MIGRVYKDSFRENVFRTFLFTDRNIAIGVGAMIALVEFLVYVHVIHHFNWVIFAFSAGITEMLCLFIALSRIDNQPRYAIWTRKLFSLTEPKKQGAKYVGTYFTDAIVQDNYLVQKDSIALVCQITPRDITGLQETEQELFFSNVKRSLLALSTDVQILARKEHISSDDILDHIFYLESKFHPKDTEKEIRLRNYHADLRTLIDSHMFLRWRLYAIFSLPANPKNTKEKVQVLGKLRDIYRRFATSMEQTAGITVSQLTNIELNMLLQQTIRL